MKLKFILPCLALTALVFAKEPLVKPQSQGDVNFISGGIGGDERDAMQAIRADYNMNLLFSEKGSGEYLSDVNVTINDADGKTVLETVSDGPMLFVKLKPGRYLVSATSDGQVVQKTVMVQAKQQTPLSFTWAH